MGKEAERRQAEAQSAADGGGEGGEKGHDVNLLEQTFPFVLVSYIEGK